MQASDHVPRGPSSVRAEDVEQVLGGMAWPTIRFLRVTVQEGVVALEGCIGSYHERRAPCRRVQDIEGRIEVVSR